MSRQSANCQLLLASPLPVAVIILKREITNGGILSASEIFLERGIAHGVVTESGLVSVERKGADSIVK
jgi:hypothetical protein